MLLDFLALLRFLVLIVSVHKLFDVCRDVFAKNNGSNAVLLRSVIARHFRELLDDLLWIIRPLWTFDWSLTLVFTPIVLIIHVALYSGIAILQPLQRIWSLFRSK